MTYRVITCIQNGDAFTVQLVADTGDNNPPLMTLWRHDTKLPEGALVKLVFA